MFGAVKKAAAVAAVVGALGGAATTSADEWDVPFPTSTQVSAGGTLEIYVFSMGTTTRCANVTTNTAGVTLNNGLPTSGPWGAMGLISSLNLNSCAVVGIPACIVSLVVNVTGGGGSPGSLPWEIVGDAASQRVSIRGMEFMYTYAGAGCPLAGFRALVGGDVEGDYDSSTGTLSFSSEPGLTVASPPLGAASLSGWLDFDAVPALKVS